MLKSYRIVREAAQLVADAAEATVPELRELRRRDVDDVESAFTDRMLDRIQYAVDGYRTKGVGWRAETLVGEEAGEDADFFAVLDVSLPSYRVVKGFLARAACIASGDPVAPSELDELRDSSRRMLARSSASFLFLYARDGIRVVPALAVASSGPINPHRLYPRMLERFYEEHFACFFGDRAISPEEGEEELARTAARLGARSGILLEAREVSAEPDRLF